MGSDAPTLPVIDLSKEDLKPGSRCWLKTCGDVRQALEEYGCFMVNYTKFTHQLREAVFSALKELFHLPTETKMKNKSEKPFSSYLGQNPRMPLAEGVGIDNATCLEETQSFTNLMWPNGNERFRECVNTYTKMVAEVDQMVSKMIFESYGVEKYHDSYLNSTTHFLRLLKYRAPKEDELSNVGFATHTDKSFISILHQNRVNGLEIDYKDGKKIKVEHFSPSSFVVLAGDALMAWSNDRIKSPTHRVIMNGKVDRYSIGLFSFNNGMIEAPQELVDEEHPLMYKPLDHIGLLRFFFTEEGYKSKCPVKAYCGI